MSEVILSDSNFENEVAKSKGLVLVDFYAEWCGPCKMMAPAIEKMAKAYEGKVKVCKLNVDESPAVSTMFEIQGIPTLIYFKDGQPVGKDVGFQSEEKLKQSIENHLA